MNNRPLEIFAKCRLALADVVERVFQRVRELLDGAQAHKSCAALDRVNCAEHRVNRAIDVRISTKCVELARQVAQRIDRFVDEIGEQLASIRNVVNGSIHRILS